MKQSSQINYQGSVSLRGNTQIYSSTLKQGISRSRRTFDKNTGTGEGEFELSKIKETLQWSFFDHCQYGKSDVNCVASC